MEPSTQKFLRDFRTRVAEPDGPAHVYGQLPATDDIGKNIDKAVDGANAVKKTLDGAH